MVQGGTLVPTRRRKREQTIDTNISVGQRWYPRTPTREYDCLVIVERVLTEGRWLVQLKPSGQIRAFDPRTIREGHQLPPVSALSNAPADGQSIR